MDSLEEARARIGEARAALGAAAEALDRALGVAATPDVVVARKRVETAAAIGALLADSLGEPSNIVGSTQGNRSLDVRRGNPKTDWLAVQNLAGRGFAICGMILVLVGAATFVDLGISYGWFPPGLRIAIGSVCGAAAIVVGAGLLAKSHRWLGESVVALGAGIVSLCIWGGAVLYPELHISYVVLLSGVVATVAATSWLAWRHRSESLALAAAACGLLSPTLLGTGWEGRASIALLLLPVALGFAFLAATNGFLVLEALVAVGIALAGVDLSQVRPGWTVLDASAWFLAMVTVLSVGITVGADRKPQTSEFRQVTLIFVLLLGAVALEYTLWNERVALGVTFASIAVVSFFIARRRMPERIAHVWHLSGLAYANCALPALFRGFALVDVVIIEAGLLVRSGLDRRAPLLVCGAFAYAASFCWVLSTAPSSAPFPSARDLSLLEWTISVWIAAALVRHRTRGTDVAAQSFVPALIATGFAVDVVVTDAVGSYTLASYVSAAAAVSLSWTLLAIVVLAFGGRTRSSFVRWEGFALFAVTTVKVTAFDSVVVFALERVAAFVGLGLVLVAVSVWNARLAREERIVQHAGSE